MRGKPPRRRGVTLVELIVVLVILAALGGVSATTLPAPRTRTDEEKTLDAVARLRAAAIETGAPRESIISIRGTLHAVLALPDGSILSDSPLGFERYAGRPSAHRR